MKANKRREELLKILKKADKPIIGSKLAKNFDVSRQVIVQDIALLRAAGENIIATSQGYLLKKKLGLETVRTTIACKHKAEDVKDELSTIVSYGAKVIDVIVEHPIYGELNGLLMVQSKRDIENFMERYRKNKASLLSALTDGVHLHTIEAMNNEVIDRIKMALKEKGYLLQGN